MRTCEAPGCGNLIDQDRRSDSIYCSNACKRRAMRARKKKRRTSNFLGSIGTGSESGESDGEGLARTHAADARFRTILAADEAQRTPDAQAAEWAAYARRHGTIHPDEQAARIRRGREARAQDWVQGTERFRQPTSSLAEQARASRARQRRPVLEPIDDDDDMLEPPSMVQGDIFRSGYRHANAYR